MAFFDFREGCKHQPVRAEKSATCPVKKVLTRSGRKLLHDAHKAIRAASGYSGLLFIRGYQYQTASVQGPGPPHLCSVAFPGLRKSIQLFRQKVFMTGEYLPGLVDPDPGAIRILGKRERG